MARGYPDFFGNSIFPGYGSPLSIVDAAHVVAGFADYKCVDLAFKGSTGPGFILITDAASFADITIDVSIDGVAHFGLGVDNFLNLLAPVDRLSLISLVYLDLAEQRAVLTISPGIIFGQSLIIQVTNGLVPDIEVSTELLYYVVQ